MVEPGRRGPNAGFLGLSYMARPSRGAPRIYVRSSPHSRRRIQTESLPENPAVTAKARVGALVWPRHITAVYHGGLPSTLATRSLAEISLPVPRLPRRRSGSHSDWRADSCRNGLPRDSILGGGFKPLSLRRPSAVSRPIQTESPPEFRKRFARETL